MDRKKMHKRKGKWVTISTSLVASLMVGASAQTLVSAQEDASNYAYTEDDSVAFDSNIYAENEEVETSVEEPVVEDSVYIEETTVESLVEEVPYYAEETVAAEAEWLEDAPVLEEIPVEEPLVMSEPIMLEETETTQIEEVIEEPMMVEPVADTAVTPDATQGEEPADEVVEPVVEETTSIVDLTETDVVSEVVDVEPVEQTEAIEPVEEVNADQAVVDAEIPTEFEEPAVIVEDENSDYVSGIELPAEPELIEDEVNSEIIVDANEPIDDTLVEDVVETDDTVIVDLPVESEESTDLGVITEEAPTESEDLIGDAEPTEADEIVEEIEEVVEESDVTLPIEEETPTTEEFESTDELEVEKELTEEIEETNHEVLKDEEQVEETVEAPVTVIEAEEVIPAAQTPAVDSTEKTVIETPTKPVKEATQPNTTTNSETKQTYTVNQGDTLWSLARKNNVSVNQLKEWNSLSNDSIIANASLIVANPSSNATNSNDKKRQTEAAINPTSATSTSQQNTGYTVSRGDTLYSIARRNKVTVNDLKQWNNLTSDTIYANRTLIVANSTSAETPAKPSKDETSTSSYTVSRGDTLWSIARRNNVTVAQLQEWNNISGNNILANQKLVVSRTNNSDTGNIDKPSSGGNTTTPSETSAKTHTVNRGEYLYSIARQYGVTVNQLREWNKLQDDNVHPNANLIVSKPGSTTGGNNATTPDKDKDSTESPAAENANKQAVIDWFKDREGKVTYSMSNRLGPDSYDCSSAVFFALMEGGYLPQGTWPGTTESLYDLEGSLLTAISRDEVQAGDVFVAGHKGFSLGSGGHTGIALSNSSIIHSNYSDNGISTTPIEGYTSYAGMPTYWYRLNENFR